MKTQYYSESEKVKDLPNVMQFITGRILDVGCGEHKIIPEAVGVDGRPLPGVDIICDSTDQIYDYANEWFDTVFSSHFLEHCEDQYATIEDFYFLLKMGGHLVLYLPDGRHYNNQENPEHMIDMNYDQFMFWFKRAWCGEGKNFRGEHIRKRFELIAHGMDVGPDRYSFYVIAKRV